jgi:hypothetical protein
MKSCRRRWDALSLVGICGFATTARAKEVDLHVEGGMLVGVGVPEMSPRPTLGGDVSWWWAPTPRFQLGVETGLAMTVLSYGCADTKLSIGERGHAGCGSGLTEHFTWLPRLSLGARLFVTPATALQVTLGTMFFWPTVAEVGFLPLPLEDITLIPAPTAGIAVETRVGAAGRSSLRAGLAYIIFEHAFLMPTLAVSWT